MGHIAGSSETETQILKAALCVFGQKGKDGARMQEIADEAGINKAMLHYYFRNKDTLYEAVFRYVHGHFFSVIESETSKEQSFKQMLKGIIDTLLDEHVQHPDVNRLWTHENLSGAHVVRRILEESKGTGLGSAPGVLAERIREAVDKGEIRSVHPMHFTMTLMGSIIFFFLAAPVFSTLMPDIVEHPEKVLAERKQHLFDILYNGLSN